MTGKAGVPPRDARATRRLLLEAGQWEVYLHGFQAANLTENHCGG